MKILIVNQSDIVGGAARAAFRLVNALADNGIDVSMLVHKASSNSDLVIKHVNPFAKIWVRIRSALDNIYKLFYKNRSGTLYSPAMIPFSEVANKINVLKPDIVHLHWVCGGYIRIEDLAKINAPIVWSLHDMWAFTGGCHYDEGCEGYLEKCNSCKVLGKLDDCFLSSSVFKRKKETYRQIQSLTIVGLSKWISDCAQKSSLLSDKNVVNIPNPIDCSVFSPLDTISARERFNLPQDKKLVLFCAMNATSDKRKGFQLLYEALRTEQFENVELVVVGSGGADDFTNLGYKVHNMGQVSSDADLAALYSAADVSVMPSLQENLANTIMESLSCGTPVVAFNIGGNPDMILHKQTGYLAVPFDIEDLAKGIKWILDSRGNELSEASRTFVLEYFSQVLVAEKYIELYADLISRNNSQ